MKKGPLSKAEKYCIDNMNQEGSTVEEISEFLDRSESMVTNHLGDEAPQEVEAPNKNNTTQFIRETAEKRNKGVSIMTPEQSTRSDDMRSNKQSKKMGQHIHKISDDG